MRAEPEERQAPLDAQPRVETDAYGQMMLRMVRAYGRRVAAGDVEDLADLVALRGAVDEAIAAAVVESRRISGRSWADIARATGTTRQAAQQRWGPRGADASRRNDERPPA